MTHASAATRMAAHFAKMRAAEAAGPTIEPGDVVTITRTSNITGRTTTREVQVVRRWSSGVNNEQYGQNWIVTAVGGHVGIHEVLTADERATARTPAGAAR